MVQLTDELIAKLDAEAARKGLSRSAVLRDAVVGYFAREDDLVRAHIEGYERIPCGVPDEWGNLGQQTDADHDDLLAVMNDEERRQGLGSW